MKKNHEIRIVFLVTLSVAMNDVIGTQNAASVNAFSKSSLERNSKRELYKATDQEKLKALQGCWSDHETWKELEELAKNKGIEIDNLIQSIDKIFPLLGFKLAGCPENKKFESVENFECINGNSSENGNLRKAKFKNKCYILKMSQSVEIEVKAGEKIRQAFAQEITKIAQENQELDLNGILNQAEKDLEYLKYLLAPIGCHSGEDVATLEIENAFTLNDIIHQEAPSHEQAKKEMDFETAKERIEMAEKIVKCFNFLFKAGINYTDHSNRSNFLFENKKYCKLCLMDFDKIVLIDQNKGLMQQNLFSLIKLVLVPYFSSNETDKEKLIKLPDDERECFFFLKSFLYV